MHNGIQLPQIEAGKSDGAAFIQVRNFLLRGIVRSSNSDELWIIQIENWFDHKWLRFSGTGKVDFQFPEFMKRDDGALGELRQDNVTFPPFSPK